jgi:hypothetical protein
MELDLESERRTGAALGRLGFHNIARGFYTYNHGNGEGGARQLMLSRDGRHITEHGIPDDPQQQPFVRLLERQ